MIKKTRIVIADDHKMIREAWQQLLGMVDTLEVIGEAKNGLEVVAITKAQKPDLILMDLNMPEMNGVDASREIKLSMPWVKIIALTVQAELAFIKSMLQLGVEGFVTKNSEKEELFDAINKVVRGEKYICHEVAQILVTHSLKDEQEKSKELTKREIEIIQLIAQGLTSSQIAADLYINVKTIESHRRNIFKKLGIKNSAELIKIALEKGLILKV